MPNKYTSEKKTIGQLLSRVSYPLVVPGFQRDFSWNINLIATFWEDLISFSAQYPDNNISKQEYFLGPIVLIDRQNKYEILDGQQRLATATILLSVIRDALKQFKNSDASTRTQEKYIGSYDDYKEADTFYLTLNHYDKDFFKRDIQEKRDSAYYNEPTPKLASHKLIRKARNFFLEKFGEKYTGLNSDKEKVTWVKRIQKVLTDHISVVAVTSEDEDNAATVFETLNDRGIGLSAPDLLRNLLLRRIKGEKEKEEIIECWKDILEINEGSKVEDFLRHFWISRAGDVKTRSLYREMKKHIIEKRVNSLSFTRELQKEALIYNDIINGESEDAETKTLLAEVLSLNAKLLLPIILSSYMINNLDKRRKLLHNLISLFVRYNIIVGLDNSKLETFLFEAAKNLRKYKNFDSRNNKIKKYAPSDHDFRKAFKTAEITRHASARYILTKIEYKKRLSENIKIEEASKVNLEHIYPRGAITRLPNHDQLVYRIGNLTLLSKPLNKKLKNKDFLSKKESAYVKSEFIITNELKKYRTWNQKKIEKRQKEFSELVNTIWNFIK